ncbi:hypothetical protein ACEWY4_021897 [Coilia grayii]|uniref:Inactive serine protease 35 n=1 Tax=Coilia grayii TaxID=363190 RepID=A0ABD1J4P0_9TELE
MSLFFPFAFLFVAPSAIPTMMRGLLQTLLAFVIMLDLYVWAISGNHGNRGDTHTWQHAAVPLVVERSTVPLSQPDFHATLTQSHSHATLCGIQCQDRLPKPDRTQLERLLAYETVYANGTRTLTEVRLRGTGVEAAPPSNSTSISRLPRRHRRQVFGADGRFVISDRRFTASFPFSASVKLSSGCSGILVAPRHVLTAAHCVHDGQNYLKESRELRVGVMRSQISHNSKVGRRKGGGGGEEEKDTQGRNNEGESSKKRGERKKGRGKRRRGKARARRAAAAVAAVAATDPDKVSFRWARVKQIHTPRGWMKGVGRQLAPDYDYALLELRRPLGATPMELGLVADVKETVPSGRIHFTGFDHDQPGKAVYRFCSVTQESSDLLYQYCDARAGSSGAGVYVRLRESAPGGPDGGKKGRVKNWKAAGKWTRKVIGVFSGHQWVDDNGAQRDYNVAVRITPAKFAQICHWIHADPKRCQQA